MAPLLRPGYNGGRGRPTRKSATGKPVYDYAGRGFLSAQAKGERALAAERSWASQRARDANAQLAVALVAKASARAARRPPLARARARAPGARG